MTLRRFLKRLRLKQGDILLVEHGAMPYNVVETLIQAARSANIKVNCPILMHNGKHSIERMPFEEIERIYLEAKKSHGRL